MTSLIEPETPAVVVTFRGLPSERKGAPPPLTTYSPRLSEKNSLIVFAAADADAEGDPFGLAGILYGAGPSGVSGAVLVADDLAEWAPGQLEEIEDFVAGTPISPRPGAPAFEVLPVSTFFDPFARADCGHLAFAPTAYTGGAFTVGADLGRFFGLVAEHCAVMEEGDGWSVYPPGWWNPASGKGKKWHRATPNRPELRLMARRDGWQIGWGRTGINPETGRPYGKRYPGEHIDVNSWAYSQDADRGASFGEHRANYGLSPVELPLRVSVDAAGVAQVIEAVRAIHELALVLDEKAAQWFTTPEERNEGRGKLNIARISSPGAIAAEIPRRFKVTPPLENKFELTPGLHAAWWEGFHGGDCRLDKRFAGIPFPCVSADVSSAFPAAAVALGWWDLLTAERIEIEDVTDEVRALRERAAGDPRAALDPVVWQRLGFTLVTERILGEPRIIEVEEPGRADGRTETVPVFSPDRLLHYPWPDSVRGAILAERADLAEVVEAQRLKPIGRQDGLRKRLSILPGLVVDAEEDPAIALVGHRRAVKPDDPLLGSELHAVVNSLVSGNPSRTDPDRGGEVVGPGCFVPIAATVQAGAHLYLGAFERLVRDKGGCPVYCDTDSWLVLASPKGGTFTLSDGSTEMVLSWAEVDEIADAFTSMRPFGPDIEPWKVERGSPEHPLHAVVYGPKRHVEFTINDDGSPEIVERTDPALGGFFTDPPTMPGRAEDQLRCWSLEAVRRQVSYSLAWSRDPRTAAWPDAPWDAGQPRPALAVRHLQVRTPEIHNSLPPALGARPGSYYVEAVAGTILGAKVRNEAGVVALDTGAVDPWDLDSLDRATGRPVRLTVDPADIDRRFVDTLDKRTIDWARPHRQSPLDAVHVDPLLVQHRGRVSGILDADIDGLPGDLARFRPQYDPEGDAARRLLFVQRRARALGKRAFARRTGLPLKVAERAALGQRIAVGNVKKALRKLRFVDASTPRCPEDSRPVLRRREGSVYCSERCRDRAAKRRRAERLRTEAKSA